LSVTDYGGTRISGAYEPVNPTLAKDIQPGTYDYLIIAYCPSLSAYMGPGGYEGGPPDEGSQYPPFNTNIQPTSRVSGFMCMQVKGSYKDVGFFRKEAFFL
jgi:hypothetical protein